jgi:hypothetical protein
VDLFVYDTVRGDLTPLTATGTRPTIVASGISTFTLIALTGGSGPSLSHVILNGASLTAARAATMSTGRYVNCHGMNCLSGVFVGTSRALRCSATGCSTLSPFTLTGLSEFCVATGNTVTGFGGGSCVNCLSYANSGASSDGFAVGNSAVLDGCVAYGNGQHGFNQNGSTQGFHNCVAEANTGAGFNLTGFGQELLTCAGFNNTGGNLAITTATHLENVGFLTGSATFFTNAAAGDFSLNNTAGGGALLRGTGYPGVFPLGLTTGHTDIGAAPHAFSFTQGLTLGDLTTLWCADYIPGLKNAAPNALDVDTLVRDDLPNVRAAVSDQDDLNTMYAIYISGTKGIP